MDPDPRQEMPRTIGKYEILERIGTGGFGTVYRAHDPVLRRTVAVKTCHAGDEEFRARFVREARLAGSFQHPNVTTVYDFGVEDDTPYIVQEFLGGRDLSHILAQEDRLTVAEKVEVLIGAAYGLHAAHEAGIVHRDIKPGNIRVLEDGTVKIMDFGVAKSLRTETSQTRAGITLGTSGYLAPEQIRGEPIDRRTDVFALGVVAYELLSGLRPFESPTPAGILEKTEKEHPLALDRAAPGIPHALAAAVTRALAKDPAARYPSAEAFRQDLSRILESLRAGEPRSETPQPAALLEAPASPATVRKAAAGRAGEENRPPDRGRRPRWLVPLLLLVALAAILAGALLLDRLG